MRLGIRFTVLALLAAPTAPFAAAQSALDPRPMIEDTEARPKDPTERRASVEAGMITIAGRTYRQAQAVAVGATQVRFNSLDGAFSAPWEKLPWNVRARLEAPHAEAVAKGQEIAAIQRRMQRLSSLGLELIEGVVVGKSGGGILVEIDGGKGRTVLLRGHPDQSRIADQDRVSAAARPGGTHEYGAGFFAVTKTARIYDCVLGE